MCRSLSVLLSVCLLLKASEAFLVRVQRAVQGPALRRAVRLSALPVDDADAQVSALSRREEMRRASRGAALLLTALVTGTAGVRDARADALSLIEKKRSYFRYAPKFEKGRDKMVFEVKPAIDKEDWAGVMKFFTPVKKGRTYEFDLLDQPLTLFISTIPRADNKKTMEKALEEMEAQLEIIKVAAGGKAAEKESDGGFFGFLGGGSKKEEDKRPPKARALDAYKKWVDAYNTYAEAATAGQISEVPPILDIPDDMSKYQKAMEVPDNSF
uniref:PsbP C-terminal domain-containing protein n=1 Tax=Chromera velia CCMP2878 TaxID=1169474 RepID=A0A0G4FD32_9ALVE|eukprot:Cvel_16446.t1-p1 / transcript=Cvel_16446.t1 / gene=Cvel_16446 / organism=Chromera_velia_CCMP2878 / gene_product=hypothetical protein / transcript_product=hypothetical protein / location=Cvel_scaffold1267:46060-46866(-) / protein_length=269 / sequence_SO=supercontig / SO=protein_coding / is_pseudo=false